MKIGPEESRRVAVGPTIDRILRPTPATTQRGDSVKISDEARKKLARAADNLLRLEQSTDPVYTRSDIQARAAGVSADSASEIREEILREVQERLESGFYDREEVKRSIADKLVDRLGKDNEG